MDLNLLFLEETVHGLSDIGSMDGVVIRIVTVIAFLNKTWKWKAKFVPS